ncbi:MAG: histidine phosphatase family protein [Candidatus Thermoplasmatota archaeon]|jgi:probable phosphoglycerate mutase|nr:histidine phosphatase family protein [Candidatus Thermoplasmatota archaeon]
MAILMRHGESVANVMKIITEDPDEHPLTERGVEQVLFSAEQLKGLNINGIISSPILRARQTSLKISDVTGLGIRIDQRLRESGLGQYNKFKIDEVPKLSREDLGMEPWDAQVLRMRSVLDELDGKYILVSHALPIRAVTASFLDMDEKESYGMDIKHASMTIIDLDNAKPLTIGTLLLTDKVKKLLSDY